MDCRIRRGENRVPLLGRRGYYPKRPARRASGYPAPPARFVRRVYPPGGRNGHRRQGDLRSPRALRRAVAILRVRRRLPRPETELEAARITTAYTRNRRYLWASLGALSRYPALSPQLPDMPRTVDALPLGTAKVAVLNTRGAARGRSAMGDVGYRRVGPSDLSGTATPRARSPNSRLTIVGALATAYSAPMADERQVLGTTPPRVRQEPGGRPLPGSKP
jgi:hypothetical protein